MMLLRKETSWILLILLFIFDNVLSYYAISYLGAHELNLLIAFLVEKYPLLYFICIPVQILLMFFIVWVIKKIVIRVLKGWNLKEEILERVILQGFVIYWILGNSSMNLFFLAGLHELPANVWLLTSLMGVFLALTYTLLILYKHRNNID